MSGDVQPRKRKEKRRKKEDSEEVASNFSIDEHIHVHKDASTGGNICTKILFFLLSSVLLVMVGLVLLEYRGLSDDEALVSVSKWAPTFDGWLDETPAKHDEHESSGEHGPAESGDHEDESIEEEEAVSKEASEEEHGSAEDETNNTEEEEVDRDKSEEDRLEDEESEEKGDPDDDATEEEEEDDEHETEEEDGEDEEDNVPYRHVHRFSYKQIGKDIVDDDISDEGGDDNDLEDSEEKETGRDEPDDDLEENENRYGHQSDEDDGDLHEIPGITESVEDEEGGSIDEVLHEISGITESDEDDDEEEEEGENMEQSGETVKKQGKSAGFHEENKAAYSEEVDVKKREVRMEVGDEISNVRTPENKVVEEEEADEPEPSGVALKFGVGVALVIVAHVVLVRKWNSDDNVVQPDASNVVQSEPQHETSKVPKLVPQITVEQEIEKESEEMGYAASDYITRRQTLLPEDLVRDSLHRELEETDASVPSEEEEVDDGQEELVFKQNVYKAENAFKIPQRDEKPFSVEKSYKQQSFEELMKKFHELTPEGSDSESEEQEDEEEEEEDDEDDDRELEEDELVDEDDLDNEDEDSEADITKNKLSETKTITHLDAESKVPSKMEQKMMQIQVGNTGKQQELLLHEDEDEDEVEQQQHEEEEEDEEDDEEEPASEDESYNEKFRQYEFSKSRQPERGAQDSGSEKEMPATKSKIPKNMGGQNAQVYSKDDITNKDDWNIIEDLDEADNDADEKPEIAIHQYDSLLRSNPNSPRAWYGKATALDRLAAKKQSNFILDQAIDAYKKVASDLKNVPDKLFMLAAERCIDRMRFRGVHGKAVQIHKLLMERFPDNPDYSNQLAVTYLMINRNPEAKKVLENVLQKWPKNGFAQVHYGFILKTGNYNMTEAVRYLHEGISSREPGTIDGRFFFQLGDALMRLGRRKEALEVNELGVKEGLFLSKYQRSLYNVNRLQAQPWWSQEETTYAPYFRKLEENWIQIKNEGVKALYDTNKNLFKDEAENLRDSGKWKQLELFARGRKIPSNCAKAPTTCKLIEEFPAARDCRRGQVKYSVMDPGTHVWPHCGPTNCRLRAHLGLVVPKNTFIRVAEETRSWEEGKLFIFDDSFEHEVWHNGTATRLVLIVDVWHPDLTVEEKRSLPAI